MALRLARLLRGEKLSAYSEVGPFSVFSFRQRYTTYLKTQTDPTIADYFFEQYLHAWFSDVPSYNYWLVMTVATGVMAAHLMRYWLCNPDIYGRRQEFKKPLPDRHRQWSYSLPFYNHRLRNLSTKYKWCFIDNEPDYSDYHPLGYRPNRKQIHRRCWLWVFSVPRYTCQDPLFTSVSHENMERIYRDIGYTKAPKTEEE
eukprot:TRINITY_DN2577_c0_g1_i6.p2 TRINITY_DN2577_c0_g1~~TRINITY_DN2577_c0_g1_i6.p2  ORF type:complete len:200 (+),score=31.37 TRINITY_DN2577_c0_g1_i6:98-697(+)